MPTGRLVIELFTDVAPLAAAELRRRCSRGATGGLQGTVLHKVLRNLAVFGGKPSACVRFGRMRCWRCSRSCGMPLPWPYRGKHDSRRRLLVDCW